MMKYIDENGAIVAQSHDVGTPPPVGSRVWIVSICDAPPRPAVYEIVRVEDRIDVIPDQRGDLPNAISEITRTVHLSGAQ